MEEPAAENVMKIDLRELEEGESKFAFEQDPADLDIQGDEAVFTGEISTSVTLHKLSEALSAVGKSTFTIRADCARCSEQIERPYETEFSFVFQTGKPHGLEGDEDETLIWLDEESDELDLGKEVRDYILLEIPINPVCEAYESGTCPNLAQVEEIEKAASGANETDPRWAALKQVKLGE